MTILITILEFLLYLSYLLILIVLGFAVLYFVDKRMLKRILRFIMKRLITKEHDSKSINEKDNEEQEHIEILHLRKELSTRIENLSIVQQENCEKSACLDRKIISLSTELNNLRDELKDLKKEQLKKVEEKQKPKVQDEQLVPMFQPSVYYARLVDSLNPLGFFVGNLQEKADGCCFIINTLSFDRAEYTSVSDKHIQQEMIATFNPVLTKSSEYEMVPQKIDSLEVLSKGELLLSGNVWKIVKKQTIKFH